MKYITTGKIIDHDHDDREYVLWGVKTRGKDDGMVIEKGSGYCLEVKEGKYVLDMVTEETLCGSVAIRNYVYPELELKNFTYIGDERL